MAGVPTVMSRGGMAAVPAALGTRLRVSFDPLRICIFVLILLAIGRTHQHFPWFAKLRPALVFTALTGIYAYLNPRFLASGSMFRLWPARVITGLAIAACASVPFGISIGNSGAFIVQEYSKTLVLAFLIIAAIRHTRDLYTFVWAFVCATGFLAYLSLFVFRMQKAGADGVVRIAGGYTYDANDIGCVALAGIALSLLAFQASRGKARLGAGIVLVGLAMTMAKTGSRGGFLGFVALGLALVVMLKSVRLDKRLGFLGVALLALIVAAPPGYWDQMRTLLEPTKDYNWTSPTGRREVTKRGIGYMMRNPLTGIGVDNFPRAEGMISERAIEQSWNPNLPGIKWSVAHNSFLQAAAEMGIPGLALFSMLVFGGIVKTYRFRERHIPKEWARGDPEQRFLYFTAVYLPVAFVSFAVSGFFVSFAYMDLVYVLAALTAGLYACVEARLKADAGPGAPVVAPVVRYRGGLPPRWLEQRQAPAPQRGGASGPHTGGR